MTRINVVPVEELSNQHLMSEYRELPMVHGSLRRTLKSTKGFQLSRVSPTYTLNSGHVYFWYNKKSFLLDRFQQLVKELEYRGFQIDPDSRSIDWSVFDNVPQVEWSSTDKDHITNLDRIIIRLNQKPKFYKWTKREVPTYYKMP